MFTRFSINLISWLLIVCGVGLSLISATYQFGYFWDNVLLCLNIISYVLGAFLLYLGQKFRFFVINPTRIVFREGDSSTFYIKPWLEERETRWSCYLYYFGIEVSKPYSIIEIRIHDIDEPYYFSRCMEGNGISKDSVEVKCYEEPGSYRFELFFNKPLRMDINALITIKIKRSGEIPIDRKTYLEYELIYRNIRFPIKFKDTMRIF